jgi:phage terminase large subunit GpA-like protein
MLLHDQTFLTLQAAAENWRPPPPLTLSGWADLHFYLSPESAAEPGKWRTYSYQRAIMDAVTDPEVEQLTLMKSARVGYTKIINAAIAYHIDYDPCSLLVVQPTIDDAQGYSKDEIQPMIRDCSCLSGKVADAKSRDSNNTILKKAYPGGVLSLVGANSARGFRRLTVRKVFFDEVDGYPLTAGHEGDQIQLGKKRAETFWNRQYMIGSTPVKKGESRVEASFEMSDMRRLFVPCPHCGHFQALKFANMKWPKDNPHRAYFQCVHCEKEIDHRQKRAMVDAGEWRTAKPFNGHAGFHIWGAYSFSPGAAWGSIATRHVEATRHWKNTGDTTKLQTVVNTDLGETWEEKGDRVESIEVQSHKAGYGIDEIPNDVLIITAGVDVQGGKMGRLECELVGWGLGAESWSLDYYIIPGNPERADVWIQLDERLTANYARGDGVPLRVNCACIDSGYCTQMVYSWVRYRQKRRVYAVKGSSTVGLPIVGRPTKQGVRKDVILYPIGTDSAKDVIAARLEVETPGQPGYCHFPDHYPDEYFAQLTAEQAVTRYKKGVPYRTWVPIRKRNEALDCRVYATAAYVILNPAMDVIARKLSAKAEKLAEPEPKKTAPKKRVVRPARKKTRKNFVTDF